VQPVEVETRDLLRCCDNLGGTGDLDCPAGLTAGAGRLDSTRRASGRNLTLGTGVARLIVGRRADGDPTTLSLELGHEARRLLFARGAACGPGAIRLCRDGLGSAEAFSEYIGSRRSCG
jgi:hypothetical protein